MKTTELYVEQVFVGLFVILVVLLPWLPEARDAMLDDTSLGQIIGAGSVLIAAAFAIGIPFDRLSDTLSGRLDRLQRLSMAFEQAEQSNSKATPNTAGAPVTEPDDFYPEDELLMRCLRDKSAVTDRYDYLRSRVRLARALAVYGPAITLAAMVGVSRCIDTNLEMPWLFYVFAGATYALWFAFVQYADTRGNTSRLHLPRTDQCKFLQVIGRGAFLSWFSKPSVNGRFERLNDFRLWRGEMASCLAPFLMLIAALGWALWRPDRTMAATAVSGTVLVALSAWTWWRVTKTLREMLLHARADATE